MKSRLMQRLVFAVIAVVGVASVGVAPADARDNHDNHDNPGGRIVWNQLTEDFSAMHLVSSAPDGSRMRDVTPATEGIYQQDPVFSPDGKQVLYDQVDFTQGDEPPERIGLVRSRGGPAQLLDLGCVDPCVGEDLPSWTPDGRRVVFTRVVGPFGEDGAAVSAVLWTANLDGSDLRRLSEPGIDGIYEDAHARFSPDGKYIVFVRGRNTDLHVAVFRMRPDATDLRQLTPWELDADLPDVSPAGNGPTRDLVVFETHGHGPTETETQQVATVPATCTSVADCTARIRYVTNVSLPDAAFNPAWSPDGRRIAYVAFTDNGPDAAPLGVIWTVRPNGADARQVSDAAFFSFRPNWTTIEENDTGSSSPPPKGPKHGDDHGGRHAHEEFAKHGGHSTGRGRWGHADDA